RLPLQAIMDSVLNALRARATVNLLRSQPVLVVPDGVSAAEVTGYVRQWCPDVDRVADSVLALADVFELHGPVEDEPVVWERAALPAGYRSAYAVPIARDARSSPISDWTRYDLIAGLARRLRGNCRGRSRGPWESPGDDVADPLVLAPTALSAGDALRL